MPGDGRRPAPAPLRPRRGSSPHRRSRAPARDSAPWCRVGGTGFRLLAPASPRRCAARWTCRSRCGRPGRGARQATPRGRRLAARRSCPPRSGSPARGGEAAPWAQASGPRRAWIAGGRGARAHGPPKASRSKETKALVPPRARITGRRIARATKPGKGGDHVRSRRPFQARRAASRRPLTVWSAFERDCGRWRGAGTHKARGQVPFAFRTVSLQPAPASARARWRSNRGEGRPRQQ